MGQGSKHGTSETCCQHPNAGLLASKAQKSFSLCPLGFGLGLSPATPEKGVSSTFLLLLLPPKVLGLSAFEPATIFTHNKELYYWVYFIFIKINLKVKTLTAKYSIRTHLRRNVKIS